MSEPQPRNTHASANGFLGYASVNIVLPFLGIEKNGPVLSTSSLQRPTNQSSVNELVPKLDPLNPEFAVCISIPADRIKAASLSADPRRVKDLELTDSVLPFKAELVDGNHRQSALLKKCFPAAADLKAFNKFCDMKREGTLFNTKEAEKWKGWVERLRVEGRWVTAIYDKGESIVYLRGNSPLNTFRSLNR